MPAIGATPIQEAVTDRLAAVREAIAEACARVGREPGRIRIVAVTKGHPVEAVTAAIRAGLGDIGESRVQEALSKFDPDVLAKGGGRVRRHMLGPLQRNKARDALALFDWIQSIDSLRLARTLSQRVGERPPVQVLVEANVAGERHKHGFAPEQVVEAGLEIGAMPGLELRGVMAMAPWTDDQVAVRGAFGVTRRAFEDLQRQAGGRVDTLSMGMTNDYRLAVEEGSSMVRVGTALFGPGGR